MRQGIYEPIPLDEPGRLISDRLGLSLVRWQGTFKMLESVWLRWATLDGELLPTDREDRDTAYQQVEQERQRTEQERQRTEQERQRADRLAEELRRRGIDPDSL